MLPDILASDLVVIFVGTAKSTTSARAGHYYATPQNMFWNLLEATGLAGDAWIGPSRDQTVLEHGVGLTDLVPARAASSDAILKASDYDVPGFLEKVERYKPAVVAFNGEPAAGKVARYLKQPTPAEGPAAWRIGHALVYRLPSSSSANARGGYAAKRAKWVEFGQWVEEQQCSKPSRDARQQLTQIGAYLCSATDASPSATLAMSDWLRTPWRSRVRRRLQTRSHGRALTQLSGRAGIGARVAP